MKLIGILLIAGACAGVGIYAERKLYQETKKIEQLIVLLETAAAYIRCQSPELCDLLQLLSEECDGAFGFLQEVVENLQPGITPAALWRHAVEQDASVPLTVKDILCSLGAVLGTTDKTGQLSTIALHKERLLLAAGESHDRCHRQGKLFRSLGLLGGAMAAVLLL